MPTRALVYGDVDLNLIDGSAVWVQGVVTALAAAGCRVTLVLKAPVRTTRLLAPLEAMPEVEVHRPHGEEVAGRGPLTVRQAAAVLDRVDLREPYDLALVRGRRLAAALAHGRLAGRLWTYLTDVPQTAAELTGPARGEITRIARASRILLCQTEELRGFLEAAVPAAAGRCVLFPPVVVLPEGVRRPDGPPGTAPVRLVYTGKFAPLWNTHEMAALPRLLAARGLDAELHMVGDKIHDDPGDPGYAGRMRRALESSPGVVWHGGLPRAEAMRIAAGCDIGLSWRHPRLDGSLELSTKVLEMAALGVPPVVNPTPMHQRLLGPHYPLFAAGPEDLVEVIEAAVADPATYARAVARGRAIAAPAGLEAAAGRLAGCLDAVFPGRPGTVPAGRPAGRPAPGHPGRPLRVAVAGHDLKFFTGLLDHLGARPDMELRVDRWHALNQHDPERSRAMVDWADVVICEWCGANALWYADHKRPGQRLVVRLHRFELYTGWPNRLDIRAVDAVVCVSGHYAALTRRMTGWPAAKIVTIPNAIDVDAFDRDKFPGAEHHLGVIGIAPSRKRLDLALDTVAELRRHDPRFTLFVKSRLPWDLWWIWRRPEERAYYERVFRRIRRAPELAGAVVFCPPGGDVAAWLRRIGHVLSTSDDESFHLAPAEGMASGAVPALLNWPGADQVYDPRWVHPDPVAMATAIAGRVAGGSFAADAGTARAQVRAAYALGDVGRSWAALLTRGNPAPS